ncbi:hypothetical protein [Pseudomonas citronellolis]|uniref:hypothetical protein n=1 Tax=Pseudomonas citronellolis TaxID=53408 RepID=UPI0021BEC622|nr:hypothetical protein [Pseudomonas citronellolis]UXJ53546.1 hypothetical protein N5P21_04805 [Pseudomonas citronellolis]
MLSFYDFLARFCDIETVEGLIAADSGDKYLIQATTAHISQFHLLGAIGHRRSIKNKLRGYGFMAATKAEVPNR